jgi:hypothetical protein
MVAAIYLRVDLKGEIRKHYPFNAAAEQEYLRDSFERLAVLEPFKADGIVQLLPNTTNITVPNYGSNIFSITSTSFMPNRFYPLPNCQNCGSDNITYTINSDEMGVGGLGRNTARCNSCGFISLSPSLKR